MGSPVFRLQLSNATRGRVATLHAVLRVARFAPAAEDELAFVPLVGADMALAREIVRTHYGTEIELIAPDPVETDTQLAAAI